MMISVVRESFVDDNRDLPNHQKRDGHKRIPVQNQNRDQPAWYRDLRLRLRVKAAPMIGLMGVAAWCDP